MHARHAAGSRVLAAVNGGQIYSEPTNAVVSVDQPRRWGTVATSDDGTIIVSAVRVQRQHTCAGNNACEKQA